MEEGGLDRLRAGAQAQVVGAVLGEDLALAHEQQAVAALGFVHDVRGDEDRRAALFGEAVEEVPEVAAQDGVEADGRFVEDEQFGCAEQGDGEGDAGALASGEPACEGVGVRGEVDVGDGAGDVFAAGLATAAAGFQYGGEVVEVLADRQVVVDGGVLGDIADPRAEGGVAGGLAEDLEGAGDLGLRADDGTHQGRLSAAGRAEEAGDTAGRDAEVDTAQDGAVSSYDGEAAGQDGQARRIHHAMNNAPGAGPRQEMGVRQGHPPWRFGGKGADRGHMSHNSEISKAERRRLAIASATLGPWRAAAVVGGLGGGVALAFGAIDDGIGLGLLAGALSVALMLFFMVGGAGAVLGGGPSAAGAADTDRRIRRWAAAHPWRVAAVPGALMVAADVVVRQVLTSQGFFGSLWEGLWRGALVVGVVGMVGRVSRGRR